METSGIQLKMQKVTGLKEDRAVRDMYRKAFPKIEQLPYWRLKIGSHLKTEDFFVFMFEGKPVAHAFLLVGEENALLYYFAVTETLRGTGIGSQSLALLKKHYDKPLLVIMKPMDDDADDATQRLRRKTFYERAGFKSADMTVTDWSGSFSVFTTGDKPDTIKLYKLLKRFNPFDRHLSITGEGRDE